jgi:hypothetical protein
MDSNQKPIEMNKVKKIVVTKLSTRTGVKALGTNISRGCSNNSCGGTCKTL